MTTLAPSPHECVCVTGKQGHTLSRRVLVVENNPSISGMLRWTLEYAGYSVTEDTGREGWIERERRSDDPPALILFDISLSSQGTTVLHEVRAAWHRAPPIIVMTTNTRIYEELSAVEWVIRKPFHIWELLDLVKSVLPLAFLERDRRFA